MGGFSGWAVTRARACVCGRGAAGADLCVWLMGKVGVVDAGVLRVADTGDAGASPLRSFAIVCHPTGLASTARANAVRPYDRLRSFAIQQVWPQLRGRTPFAPTVV